MRPLQVIITYTKTSLTDDMVENYLAFKKNHISCFIYQKLTNHIKLADEHMAVVEDGVSLTMEIKRLFKN